MKKVYTVTKFQGRKELDKILDKVQLGDKVELILKGVNHYLMELAKEQIRLAFEQVEKEVSDLHQRTKEGIETARKAE